MDIEEIVSDRGRSFRSLNEEGETDKNNPGDVCPARFGCPSTQRDQCHSMVKRYHIEETLEEEQDNEEDRQTLRHLVLLILLACSMFVVSITVCSYIIRNLLIYVLIGSSVTDNTLSR